MATARKRTTRRKRTTTGTTTRRRRRTTTTPVRRRRTTRKKGLLSEMFNPAMAQSSAKAMFAGVFGGMGAITVLKMTPNQNPNTQAAILGGLAFTSAALLKMPNVAAGMSAIAVYRLMENAGMLADDMSLANFADPIEQLPAVLNEDGTPNMYLAQNEDMYLADYQIGYAPDFSGANY